MKPADYKHIGKDSFSMKEAPHGADNQINQMKDELIQRTDENLERISHLQNRLNAEAREGLVVVFQGMDAAGKDSAIRHLMPGLNPQGVNVYSFKAPSSQELMHDYLWRIGKCLPRKGDISIFNRSHYEDVLAVDVLKLYKDFPLPSRCLKGDFIQKRLSQIAAFEEYLYDNGIRMVKIFLNVSKREQQKRLLERLDKPQKNWKFSAGDLDTRALWDDYQASYERAINATSTPHCPWYAIPADNKWFTRYLISEAVLEALEKINPQYPGLSSEALGMLPKYRAQLQSDCK